MGEDDDHKKIWLRKGVPFFHIFERVSRTAVRTQYRLI
jgi:hypothetical protein